MKKSIALLALMLSVILLHPCGAWAWGRDGHETVGNLAALLIAGTNAERGVASLLHTDETLVTAAEWADCAKGFRYCHAAPTTEMAAFTSRNPRHHSYHYTDVPFQLPGYQESLPGTDKDDVVHILNDAIRVLQGQPVADPSHRLTQREALFVLAHMVGDIHQPLHVGAAYIDDSEQFVVPKNAEEANATFTAGGNWLCHGATNLHSFWDDDVVVNAMKATRVTTSEGFAKVLLAKSRKVKLDAGPPTTWPTRWATETIRLSKQRLAKLAIKDKRAQGAALACQISGPRGQGFVWDIEFPNRYAADGALVAQQQLASAGARLASVLQAIWP